MKQNLSRMSIFSANSIKKGLSSINGRSSSRLRPVIARKLPALADSRRLRLLVFFSLYIGQGVPYGLFLVAFPSWLAARGHSSTEVGLFIATVSLPWTLKLLAGPVMDRFSFPSMGRRRPWVLLAKSGIVIGCMILSTGITGAFGIFGIGFLISSCAAWQDVAVDGMART